MIRFHLLISSAIIIIIAILSIGVFSLSITLDTINNLEQKRLEQLTLATDKTSQLWVRDIQDELTQWAESNFMINALNSVIINKAPTSLSQEALSRLNFILSEKNQYKALAIIDNKQNIVLSTGTSESERNFMAFLPIYYEVMPIDPSPQKILQLYQWQEGTPLYSIIKEIPTSHTNHFYLVALINIDTLINNTFLPAWAEDNSTILTLTDTRTKKSLSTNPLFENINKDTSHWISSNRDLAYIGWTITAYKDKASIKTSAYILARKISIVALIAFLVHIIFKGLFVRYTVFMPIEKLSNLAQEITKNKDYSHRSEYKSLNEIGKLANSFNSMLDEIERHEMQLSQANSEITETSERLAIAHKRAEENRVKAEMANQDKTRFLQSLSFILRSPLNSIVMLSQELFDEKKKFPPEHQKSIQLIQNNAHILGKEIDNILHYSEPAYDSLSGEDLPITLDIVNPLTKKQKIILIDTNMRQAYMISSLLKKRNFSVEIANNKERFVEKFSLCPADFVFISTALAPDLKQSMITLIDEMYIDSETPPLVLWIDDTFV